MKKDLEIGKWRAVGRKVYVQVSDEPSDDDVLVGFVLTPDAANYVVEAVNSPRLVPVDESADSW